MTQVKAGPLHIVPKQKNPLAEEQRQRRRMATLREQLLRAALRYIAQGDVRTRKDRLREASDLTGVPRVLLESAGK